VALQVFVIVSDEGESIQFGIESIQDVRITGTCLGGVDVGCWGLGPAAGTHGIDYAMASG
jgi:hypothetical protein